MTERSLRLERQLAFLLEADKVKQVVRRNLLSDGSRRESDGEHMWHLALMAIVLAEYADEPVDLMRVLRMLLIHDLVEIDAGDTFAYDTDAHADKQARELAAAERIFAILPDDQAQAYRALWDEFEERRTPDARFAAALDRLAPLLLNHASGGRMWRERDVSALQVRDRNILIAEGSASLWERARELIDDAVARGLLEAE